MYILTINVRNQEVSNIQDSEWWQIVPACCAALCSKKTSLKSLVLQVSVLQTDRSSPLLRLLPGRLVLQTPARGGAVSANLISPSQHARSLSAPRPSSPAGFRVIGEGWRSAALFFLLPRPIAHVRSWVKTVTLQLPWQPSVPPSCLNTFQTF